MFEQYCNRCGDEITYEATSEYGRIAMVKGTKQPHAEVCQGVTKPSKVRPAGYKAVSKEIRRKKVERQRRAM